MEEFIENYIKPLKNSYVLLGALITLFTLLQGAFEGVLTLNLLSGMILFGIFMVFLSVLVNTYKITNKIEIAKITSTIYTLFLSIFTMILFISIYLKFGKTFMAFLGLMLGFVVAGIIVKIRAYFVIFQRSRKYQKTWRIIFLFIAIFLLFSITLSNKSVTESLDKKLNIDKNIDLITEGEWFYITFNPIFILNFITLLIISLIDIFRKKPIFSDKYIWEKTPLYNLLKKNKNQK